jgi:hypothetical protein
MDSPRAFTAAEIKDVIRSLRATGKFKSDELAAMELLCSVLRSATAATDTHLETVVQLYLKSIPQG